MPRDDFLTLSVRKDLIKKIDEFLTFPWKDTTVSSRSALLNDALDEYFQKHKLRFEHINTYEDHASLLDRELKTELSIYFKPDGIAWCTLDESQECIHIEYVLSLPNVLLILKEQGWKRKIQP